MWARLKPRPRLSRRARRGLRVGTRIEKEHVYSKRAAAAIAAQHLAERPDYYRRLMKYVERNPGDVIRAGERPFKMHAAIWKLQDFAEKEKGLELTYAQAKEALERMMVAEAHRRMRVVDGGLRRANPVTATPGSDWARGRIHVAQSIVDSSPGALFDEYVWEGGYLRFMVVHKESRESGSWWYGIYYDTKKGKKAVGVVSLHESADHLSVDDALITRPYLHKGLYRAALVNIRKLAGKPIRSARSRSAAADKSWKKSGATFLEEQDQWQMNPRLNPRHVLGGFNGLMPTAARTEPRAIRGLRLGKNKNLLCFVGHFKVYEVDGMHVRNQWADFIAGGNPEAYRFVPKNEIWVDSGLKYHWDKVCIAWHEIIETLLMKHKGWSYMKAHHAANIAEQELRQHDRRQATLECFQRVVLGCLMDHFGQNNLEKLVPMAYDIARGLHKI